MYIHISLISFPTSSNPYSKPFLDLGLVFKKPWYIHPMEYYLAIKKNKILASATAWMDLEGIMLSKITHSEEDKHHMISLICEI